METNPEHRKDLSGAEAIAKIKELAEGIMTCQFTTSLPGKKLDSRPMSTQKVTEDGSIIFLTSTESQVSKDINADSYVQLLYSHPGKNQYLAIGGTATETYDKARIADMWDPILKMWFEGPEDPKIRILTVKPEEGYYWDNKSGKAVQMLKWAYGAVTGQETDDSIEGILTV